MLNKLNVLSQFRRTVDQMSARMARLENQLDLMRLALGRIEARQCANLFDGKLNDVEFQVYSQTGEDGWIQALIRNVEIPNKIFVEFGVENYTQCNTRFLLENNYWSGLVMDGSTTNVERIKKDSLYWRRNLKAEAVFIDRDNINELLSRNGISGDIGLLSVDIDGNDYWVWKAIEVVNPRIVVCEYNSLFGPSAKVSVPYDPKFFRTTAHYSNLYYGASIAALTYLAEQRNYSLVGSNRFGNNIFFVRNDVRGSIPALRPEDAWVPAAFRESRDSERKLSYLNRAEALKLLADLPLIEVVTERQMRVGDLK